VGGPRLIGIAGGRRSPPCSSRLSPRRSSYWLCVAFLRVDPAALRGCLGGPVIVLAATAWTDRDPGPVRHGAILVFGSPGSNRPIFSSALILQAVASPMLAAPALAALMGLDSTLVLVTLGHEPRR